MKVTIKDVAREANVATSTVSRVLSNSPRISQETKEKVLKAIEKLNYKPNAIARSLANNKTRILGVVLPSEAQNLLTNPFFVQAMKGMSMCAQSKDYYITYAFSKDQKSEKEYIQEFTNSNLVDGLVLLRAKSRDENIQYLKKMNFPFVVIGRPENMGEVLWVDNDNFQATYNVVKELIKNGHRKIAFIGARQEWSMSKDRLDGYKTIIEENNIEFNENLVIHRDEFSEDQGYEAAKLILDSDDVTAIVTTDDLLAFGVIKLFKERKIKDISLSGFNNTQLAEHQKPSLSSVDIKADELGFHATKLLIDKLENNSDKKYYIIDTNFIKRDSFKVKPKTIC